MFEQIKSALQRPLPGRVAHLEMAPESRIESLINETSEQIANARKAAVLILLYDIAGETNTIFIKRPVYDGVHSGQIAFPGGRYELTDANLIETALRETEEEIGVNHKKIVVLGTLSELYIPPSNFLILPVVGCIHQAPDFVLQASEVAGILQIPLRKLGNTYKSITTITNNEITFKAPCYKIDDEIIWGATAMVINEFSKIISA